MYTPTIVYICTYYIYVYIYIYTRTYICIHVYIVHTCICVYIYTYIRAHVYTCIHICGFRALLLAPFEDPGGLLELLGDLYISQAVINRQTSLYYIYIYIYLHIYIYIYIYT